MATLGEYLGAGASTTKLLLHLNGSSVDSSGNGNNGTDSNITYSQANGKFGQGAGFTPSGSIINLPDISLTSDFTISAWIKPADTSFHYIIGKSNNTSPNEEYMIYINGTVGSVTVYIRNTSNNVFTAEQAGVGSGAWVNIVCGVSGTTPFACVNGICSNGTTITGTRASKSIGTDIGGRAYNTYGRYNGAIDEVIVEARAWTPSEVKKYYTYSRGRFGII